MNHFITDAQQWAIRRLPDDFPAMFARAKADYIKLDACLRAGAFKNRDDAQNAIDWFRSFPRYWEAIRPNFEITTSGGMVSTHRAALRDEADAFVAKIGNNIYIQNNLAIAPLLIAGILVGGIAGIAGIIWAIGYVKEQGNVSDIIDNVATANLTPEKKAELLAKIAQEQASSPGFFDQIGDVVKWAAIGLGIWFLAPVVAGMVQGKRRA